MRDRRGCTVGLRKAHGRAAELGATTVVEVLPADEQPAGLPAPVPASAGPERDAHGRFLPGARAAASKGGRARKNRTRLAAQLGLEDLAAAEDFRPYLEAADDFMRAHSAYLAEHVGGGAIGPDVGAIIVTAAWQLAASRYLNAKAIREGGDADLLGQASRLGNDSRQNLLAARELAAKAAHDRRKRRGPAPIWSRGEQS